jgi:hypothetical protein
MISDAIEKLSAELEKSDGGSLQPASEDDILQAQAFGFPDSLITFYREAAPNAIDGRVELDQRIWSVQNAIIENRDYVPGADLFPLGYVVFASNRFGDAYCIDTVNQSPDGHSPVVLFPHDVIDDGASLADVEPYRLVVASSLEDFLGKFAGRTLIEQPKYA